MRPEWVAKIVASKRGSIKMHCPVSGTEVSPRAAEVPLFEELGYIKGRAPFSDDWINNMSKNRIGRLHSVETKVKMSASHMAIADKRLGPLRGAVKNLMQAGMTREDVESVLFLTPGRVKAIRRRPKNLGHKPVTIDGEAAPVL